MSVARAFAQGAVSVVNAIVTGHAGAAFAVDLRTEAKVTLLEDVPEVEVVIDGEEAEDPMLARLALKAVVARLGEPDWGGRVETTSTIPATRGLKSSSAAANAIVLAANRAFQLYEGRALDRAALLDAAIEAALDAGVTITGAFDDASASMQGGLVVTDNRQRKVLHREDVDESLRVILLVPSTKTPTLSVKDLPYAPFAPLALEAHTLARVGRWADAMTMNGLVCGALYGTSPGWTRAALASGALAAGVSGKGPAFAAVAREADTKAVESALRSLAPNAQVLLTRPTNARAEVLS
ncbi:MAG: shikimate kinase [Thermoplasmata archaeon]|jgi:shikimate kinase|nr:shikimate kinase [Thermoplasmata archaeon]